MFEFEFRNFNIKISNDDRFTISVKDNETNKITEYKTFISPDIINDVWYIEKNDCVVVLGIQSTDDDITYRPFFIYMENSDTKNKGLKIGMTKNDINTGISQTLDLSLCSLDL